MTNELKNIAKTIREPFCKLLTREDEIAKKYLSVEKEDYLSIGGVEFNFSFAFDDISRNDEGTLICMNFFFVDIESTTKKKPFIRNKFPSFYKMEELIVNLKMENKDEGGYIQIGPKAKINEENDVTKTFKSLKQFKEYADQYMKVADLYRSFLTEVEEYAKTQVFIEISNTGIKEGYSNGKQLQEILFKSVKNLYKISICSESYEQQSYGTLYVKDDRGWSALKSINPKRDYKIDLSYKENVQQDAFSRIISDFYTLAEKVEV